MGARVQRSPNPLPLPMSSLLSLRLERAGSWVSSCCAVACGPRRENDIGAYVELLARAEGLVVAVIWFDPCVDPERDLCIPAAFERLDRDCCSGLIVAVMASPPCSTVSRARHRRLPGGGGPRPLRSRADPFVPLPHLYPRELRAVALGTHLACACYRLLAAVCLRGGSPGGWGAKEHPADPGREP